jgi:hypothetical protein
MITQEGMKKRLDVLHEEGLSLLAAFEIGKKGKDKQETEPFEVGYQRWYTRALPMVKQLASDRYMEFQAYYDADPRRMLVEAQNYTIQDYLLGEMPKRDGFDRQRETARCFRTQLAILKAVGDRIEWMLLETEDQAGRSLQLSTLETARDLIRVNERAAGALAGTVLRGYLSSLAVKHKLKLRKQSSSSRELADALKDSGALDVPVWSQATWLAEIRDRCLRPEGDAPTKLQVRDLIDGTHWLITNVF